MSTSSTMTTPYKAEAQRRRELRNAVSGVALTERDERLLDWLAGWDQSTTDALADLVTRARHARTRPLSERLARVSTTTERKAS